MDFSPEPSTACGIGRASTEGLDRPPQALPGFFCFLFPVFSAATSPLAAVPPRPAPAPFLRREGGRLGLG